MILVRFPAVHSNLVATASLQIDIIVKLKYILKEAFIFLMGGTKKKNNLVLAPCKRYLPNDRGILWYPLDQ